MDTILNDMKVSIVIPAYNEGRSISNVIKKIQSVNKDWEIIVVDDGSQDNTFEQASKMKVSVIKHNRNCGYGRSLKRGIIKAQGDIIVCIDADGQHNPADIPRLLQYLDECDMVVGERTNTSHYPLIRRPGKWILKNFANLLAGEKIPDLNSGFRIFKKVDISRYLHLMPEGFSFSTTSTFAFLKSHLLIKYVPIETAKRIGKSTVKQLKHGPQTLLLIVRLIVLFQPLKVFLSLSGLIFVFTLVSAINDIMFSKTGLADTTIILFITTLMFFSLGLVTDQVSAIRREQYK